MAQLSALESRVAAAVQRWRSDGHDVYDRFAGLVVRDADVDRLLLGQGAPPVTPLDAEAASALAAVEELVDRAVAAGEEPPRLRRLLEAFSLTAADLDLLVAVIAPDLDSRFERLYGYLNDDVTSRRATTGLALRLAGLDPTEPANRERVSPEGRLLRQRLLQYDEMTRPFLTRTLRVPDRLTTWLLGGDGSVPELDPLLVRPMPVETGEEVVVARSIRAGGVLVYLRGRPGSASESVAAAALASLGLGALTIDAQKVTGEVDLMELARLCSREARLRRAGVVVGPLDALGDRARSLAAALAEEAVPVVAHGAGSWDPSWSAIVPLVLDARPLTAAERAEVWRRAVGNASEADDVFDAVRSFRLAPRQIQNAVVAADLSAAASAVEPSSRSLQLGARSQSSVGLERLARHVCPRVGWDDLVLPPNTMRQLREFAARARHRDLVLDEWGMGGGTARRGLICLFSGPPGTGKTMAAEVVAGALGFDLYVINLATVVDKYIGETEKNLERIFSEAEGVNGVLFFDEADALFGKRSEVKDARDRYANVEVSYLLQRLERYDGAAILATNMKANVDDAFLRRLDASIDFPVPEPLERARLWRRNLRPAVPVLDDIDVDFLSTAFELTGGNISNVTTTAAYLAAEAGEQVGMATLVRATAREYRKLGRLFLASEFRSWLPIVEAEG